MDPPCDGDGEGMNFETLWRKLRLECNGELIELGRSSARRPSQVAPVPLKGRTP
jgi:hypothetical protein